MTNIHILQNKTTEQVFIANYDKQTIFHKYNENDFLHIGMLLWYINKKENEDDDDIMGIDIINDENKNLFKEKMLEYIQKKENKILNLSDFKNNNELFKNNNYADLIKKWNNDVLKKLKTYLDATSEQNDDLFYMYDIRPNGIGIEKTIQELSELYEKTDINKNRDKTHFQLWRNKIILNTVRNFKYSKINEEFLTFIILNLFKQFENKFFITKYEKIFDGKRKRTSRKKSKSKRTSRKKSKSKRTSRKKHLVK